MLYISSVKRLEALRSVATRRPAGSVQWCCGMRLLSAYVTSYTSLYHIWRGTRAGASPARTLHDAACWASRIV